MKVNGWELQFTTTHGFRTWQHAEHGVRVFGPPNERITTKVLDDYRHWVHEFLTTGTAPKVLYPAVSPEELGELIERDAYVLTDGWVDEDEYLV